jgi:NAD(P)-dependent dehydrogenase (short-subunit alcohol dehydrogenase family)
MVAVTLNSLGSGYRALVIGASGGIGQALVSTLQGDAACGHVSRLSRSADGFDITDDAAVEDAAARSGDDPFQLIICATGVLATDAQGPEKTVRQIDATAMLDLFAVNAVGPALVIKHFLPRLDRKRRSIFAFLSARVGSIGDNGLGGWISYRASKAALNQIVHTAAIEARRTHAQSILVSIHPGTVATALSSRYLSGHPSVPPEEAAANILTTLDGLPSEATGGFRAYDGSKIEW